MIHRTCQIIGLYQLYRLTSVIFQEDFNVLERNNAQIYFGYLLINLNTYTFCGLNKIGGEPKSAELSVQAKTVINNFCLQLKI